MLEADLIRALVLELDDLGFEILLCVIRSVYMTWAENRTARLVRQNRADDKQHKRSIRFWVSIFSPCV